MFSSASAFSVAEHEPILRIASDSSIVLPNGIPFTQAQKSVDFAPLEEFLHGDNTIGTIHYSYGGVPVGSADITYYNESYPINSIVFPELWPDFLVMPDEAFTPQYAELLASHLPDEVQNTPTPTLVPSPEDDTAENSDDQNPKITRKQLIIPLTAAVLIFILIALYFLVFERTYRKGRR